MEYILDTIKTESFSMDYLKFGTGKNTLVILPGLSLTRVLPAAPAIANQYKLFAEEYTVYLFERRSVLPEEYSVGDMADDTAEALNVLDLNDICLYGVSQGGMIAMLIAANHPGLVKKLVLGSTALKVNKARGKVIEEWISLASSGKTEELCLLFGKKVYSKQVFEENKSAFSAMAKIVTAEDLKRFVILAEGTAGFDASDAAIKIMCPVMVMGDTEDNVLGGDSARELAEAFGNNPQIEECIYSGYGHAAYDTAPDFPNKMYEFLK